MVKLTGPGMGTDARGQIGQVLVFAKAKNRNYAKLYTVPADRRTKSQRAMRAVVKFCGNWWKDLAQVYKDTWQHLADADNITPFNAYQATNASNWHMSLAPSVMHPAERTGGYGSFSWPTVTPVSRGIHFSGTVTNRDLGWSLPVFWLDNYGDPWTQDKLVHMIKLPLTGPYEWTWRPLETGTYNLKVSCANIRGKIWPGGVDHQITVT